MRKLLLLSTLVGQTFVQGLHGASLRQPQDTVAIQGDSITEQKIYSVFMEDYLLMCQPIPLQRVVQLGWSGEKAGGGSARLGTDLYPFHPTVVTTCYGMNDGRYGPINPEIANEYRTNQTAIVESLKAHQVRVIVLGSSKCVDSQTFHPENPSLAGIYNQTLSSLAEIDQEIAQKEGVIYADVFGATTQAMEKSKAAYGAGYVFGGSDGVHPGPNGHLVMAYAFLKALGVDGAIGTLTVDLASNQAQGSPGQKIISFQNGILEVESSRYPFCFTGEPHRPEMTTASILSSVPFNEELNRYLLVVTGLKTSRAKITWGTVSKDFSATDLKNGVNLAAEFLQNPFVGPFNKVNAAVQAQQNFETPLVKDLLHNIGSFKNLVPGDSATLDQVARDGVSRSQSLYEAAAALVTPVRHQLTIEPLADSNP